QLCPLPPRDACHQRKVVILSPALLAVLPPGADRAMFAGLRVRLIRAREGYESLKSSLRLLIVGEVVVRPAFDWADLVLPEREPDLGRAPPLCVLQQIRVHAKLENRPSLLTSG